MKNIYTGSILCLLILLSGISACEHETIPSPQLTAEQLAQVSARLYVNPDNQSAILSDAGMTESAFRLQIENISTNMDASARYRDEFEQQLLNYHK